MPGSRITALDECVLRALQVPRSASAVHLTVLHDYGTVAERSVYRSLAKLQKLGAVVRLGTPQLDAEYVRAGSCYLTNGYETDAQTGWGMMSSWKSKQPLLADPQAHMRGLIKASWDEWQAELRARKASVP